jgi:hypothetical protein
LSEYEGIAIDEDLGSHIIGIDKIGLSTVRFADKIKAATAYCLNLIGGRASEEPNNFVWSCGGFRALCEIKSNAVMARSAANLPSRIMTEEVSLCKYSAKERCIFR